MNWLLVTFAAVVAGSVFAQQPNPPQQLTVEGGSQVDPPQGDGNVTAALVVSRTNCTAPCAIHFDATGTTHANSSVNTFRDIGYYFAYGDVSPGNWMYSKNGTNTSKNYDRGGPIAAHVYETPGTFIAKVRARDSSGNGDDAQVVITVADPNTTYSGTSTICLSMTTDHTGCPSGSTRISSASSWPAFASNTRVLLHAGQNFSSLGRIGIAGSTNTRVNVSIGKYGSGASPIVNGINIDGEPPGGSRTSWSSSIMIADIDFNNNSFASTQTHTDVLCLRCTNLGGSGPAVVELAGAIQFYANASNSGATTAANLHWPIRTFFVDCEIDGAGATNGFTSYGRGTVIMGCEIRNQSQHNIRLWNAYKAVVRHNRLYGVSSNGVILKIHATNYQAWKDIASGNGVESAYNIVAENQIGASGDRANWAVVLAPQNNGDGGTTEGVRDSIVEDNHFAFDYSSEIALGGLRLTSRGNTGVGSVGQATGTFSAGVPSGWNTGYSTGGASITTEAPR